MRKATVMEDKKKNRAQELKAKEEDDPEATFKPVTLDYARPSGVTHGDKCLDLYSRVKLG